MVFKAKHGNTRSSIRFTTPMISSVDLIWGHKDVGIVLRKAAYPHQTMQRTGQLMPVYQTQLAHAQRQIPVRMGLDFIDQHAAGAVHWLQGKICFIDNCGIHIIFIVIPVATAVP